MNDKKIFYIAVIGGVAFVTALIGGALGFFGGQYWASKSSYADLLISGNQVGQKEVVIKEAKNVIIEQDVRLDQLSKQVDKSLYGVFRKKTASKVLMDQLYAPDEFITSAVAITNDGWFISWSANDLTEKGYVLVKENVTYEIDKVLTDALTKVKFIHAKAVTPQVVEFAQREKLKVGQTLAGIDSTWHRLQIANISDLHSRNLQKKSDYIQSVDNYDERLELLSVSELSAGLPMFNLDGQLVAISQTNNQGLRIAYINSLMNGVLKEAKISHPYLGVNYLELARIPGATAGIVGAMVVKNPQGIAVRADSPLTKLLQEGDIITGIEDSKISQDTSLADLIFDYKPGSSVTFHVLRQGKEFTIEKAIGVK